MDDTVRSHFTSPGDRTAVQLSHLGIFEQKAVFYGIELFFDRSLVWQNPQQLYPSVIAGNTPDQPAVIIIGIHQPGQNETLEIIEAYRSFALFPSPVHSRD